MFRLVVSKLLADKNAYSRGLNNYLYYFGGALI